MFVTVVHTCEYLSKNQTREITLLLRSKASSANDWLHVYTDCCNSSSVVFFPLKLIGCSRDA